MATSPHARPPVAPSRPVVLERHGDRRVDEYHWLRDRSDPDVIAYLEAENAYTRAMTAEQDELRARLYDEIVGRVQQSDAGAPARRGAWWYHRRTVEGLQYPIHARRRDGAGEPEQVILDVNELAMGRDFLHVGDVEVSPDHSLLAYTVDLTGGEVFTLRVRDLDRGEDLADEIEGVYYSVAWAADSRTLLYTRPDAAMRPWQVWRHRVGTAATEDALVHQEDDDRFFASVQTTRSGRLILLSLRSQVTTEVHLVDADRPEEPPRVVEPRRQGVEYSADHHGGSLVIVTNDGAPNFRLVEAPLTSPGRSSWHELVPERADVTLDAVDAFARHLVLSERSGGVRRLSVLRVGDGLRHTIEQSESVYAAGVGENLEFDTDTLRFEYSSLVTPPSVLDYDMETRARVLRKQVPVLGGYDPDLYETARLWATAPDGERVPISVVHRRGLRRDGRNPCWLQGYGAYEISSDPVFRSERLSLLERGFVVAIAHVRGGGEMGRRWYEDGKLLRKPNTFSDFIACADHLVAEGYTSPATLAIRGGSAGGLLIGAVVNARPDLFAAAVAEVPFVDIVTTMLDVSLPLTAIEWEEWGNPEDPEFYRVMLSYSPYDNVRAQDYPAMLVTAGLNDPRVGFWEPAKWVARLRARRTDARPLLLRTEMGAGHSGPSGRYDAWRDLAFVYAFVVAALGAGSEPAVGPTTAG